MVNFLWIAVLVAGGAGQGLGVDESANRTTVVSGSRPSAEVFAQLQSQDLAGVTKLYVDLGFTDQMRGAHHYLFAPEVWQEKQIEATINSMKQLLANMDQHGLVAASAVPAVSQLLAPAFGDMGVGLGPDSELQVQVVRTAFFSSNQKRVGVRLQSSSDTDDAATAQTLRSHPLAGKKGDDKKVSDYMVSPLSDLHFEDYGTGYGEQSIRSRDLASAMTILGGHFAKFDGARKAFKAQVALALLGGSPDGAAASLADLDSNERKSLESSFIGSWKANGFSSADEAQQFMNSGAMSIGSMIMVSGWVGSTRIEVGIS